MYYTVTKVLQNINKKKCTTLLGDWLDWLQLEIYIKV